MTEAQSLEQSGHIALVIRNAKALLDYLLQIDPFAGVAMVFLEADGCSKVVEKPAHAAIVEIDYPRLVTRQEKVGQS